MNVTLAVDNQFGDDGPQSGAVGIAHEIRHVRDTDETMVLVQFPDFDQATGYWCLLDHVLHAYTHETVTFWSTVKAPDDDEPE